MTVKIIIHINCDYFIILLVQAVRRVAVLGLLGRTDTVCAVVVLLPTPRLRHPGLHGQGEGQARRGQDRQDSRSHLVT